MSSKKVKILLQFQVNWRPVFSGFILQFLFGIAVIRWPLGRDVLQCFSEKVASFLDTSRVANRFVYSAELVDKEVFAFSVIAILIQFNFARFVIFS